MYKVEVEIRYEKPVLASSGGTAMNNKQKENKPMMPIAMDNHNQPPSQQSSEKIYQPLIPPRPTKSKKSQPTKTWPLGQEALGQTWLIIQRVSTRLSGRMMRTISTSRWSLERAYQPLSFHAEGGHQHLQNYPNHHLYMNWTMTLLTVLNTCMLCVLCVAMHDAWVVYCTLFVSTCVVLLKFPLHEYVHAALTAFFSGCSSGYNYI